jgi:hypothetical protein
VKAKLPGFCFNGSIDAVAHALSLVLMMNIKVVDMSIRFELPVSDDLANLFGNNRVSAGTKLRPIPEMSVSRCPSLNLFLSLVAEVNGADSVME